MENTADTIKYLEGLVEEHGIDEDGGLTEDSPKYFTLFEKQAQYLNGGVYEWCGGYASDTRILYLQGILIMNGVQYEKEEVE